MDHFEKGTLDWRRGDALSRHMSLVFPTRQSTILEMVSCGIAGLSRQLEVSVQQSILGATAGTLALLGRDGITPPARSAGSIEELAIYSSSANHLAATSRATLDAVTEAIGAIRDSYASALRLPADLGASFAQGLALGDAARSAVESLHFPVRATEEVLAAGWAAHSTDWGALASSFDITSGLAAGGFGGNALVNPLFGDLGSLIGDAREQLLSLGSLNGLVDQIPAWWSSIPLPPELAPGSFDGDFLLLDDPHVDESVRLAALDRMADRYRWVQGRERVKTALVRRARERGMQPSALLRDELRAALLLVLSTSGQPQTIRFGSEWVTDEHGKIVPVAPEKLEVDWYYRWFGISVARAVERSLLERPDRVPTLEVRGVERFERRLAPLPEGFAEDRPSPPVDDPLVLLVERDEQDEVRKRLAACLDVATPKQRQILVLLARDLSYRQVAQELGVTEGAVRAQLTLLRKRLKAS